MVVTGRNYVSAMEALEKTDLVCDYILSSGAEIRNPDRQVQMSIALSFDECEYLYEKLKKYSIGIMFCSEEKNYVIGTFEEADEGILNYIKYNNKITSEILIGGVAQNTHFTGFCQYFVI